LPETRHHSASSVKQLIRDMARVSPEIHRSVCVC